MKTEGENPLLRVMWNPNDNNYIAAFAVEDSHVFALDVRYLFNDTMVFKEHSSYVNMIRWSPYYSNSIFSCDVSGTVLFIVNE